MALRIRIFHSFVLSLVALLLVMYSSYYANPTQFHYPDTREGDPANDSALLLQESPAESFSASPLSLMSTSSDISSSVGLSSAYQVVNVTPVPDSATNVTTSHVSFHVAHITASQLIKKAKSNKPSSSVKGNSTTDSTVRGIQTKAIYESGHDIPSVKLCPEFGADLKLIIIVTSAPNHKDARMAIRQTWGHYSARNDISIGFLLGRTTNEEIQKSINAESELFGDIIQSHFIDSYNNLTLKTVSMLEWIDNYCFQVHFILKTDDDMFINVPTLLSFMEKHIKDKRTVFGRLARKWKPIRNKKSKYYISPEQYKPSVFPDFTTGPAYLLTGDVIRDLYYAALDTTYLKLEDVFTTGIVAQNIKIKRIHVNEFLNKRISLQACQIQKGISIHMVKYYEQFDIWKKLLDGRTKCK